ncbi:hypothetical protein NA612_23375, partial [Salmonella sp. NW378]|uniref:hypothetical protein n=1 Tax=Salmonella sp. NW378 TaxID=2947938 RepID=UPI003F42ABBD
RRWIDMALTGRIFDDSNRFSISADDNRGRGNQHNTVVAAAVEVRLFHFLERFSDCLCGMKCMRC